MQGRLAHWHRAAKSRDSHREVRGGHRCKALLWKLRARASHALGGVRGRYYLKGWGAEIHFGLFERHGGELLHCLYCVPIGHFIEGERHSFLLA